MEFMGYGEGVRAEAKIVSDLRGDSTCLSKLDLLVSDSAGGKIYLGYSMHRLRDNYIKSMD